jgi:hypothetical protein
VEGFPPMTLAGASVTLDSAAGVTVSAAVFVTPAATPVIVTEIDEATPRVVTANVAEVVPTGTLTLAGTVAAAVLELVSVTVSPPVGAKPSSVTVPVEGFPPTTLAGATVTEEREAGRTVSVAVLVTPEYTAVMVTEVETATPVVPTVNVAVVAPAATVIEAGTVAAAVLELDSVTTAPPAGAAAVNVTVPVAGLPPTIVDGATLTDVSAAATGGVTVNAAVLVTPA